MNLCLDGAGRSTSPRPRGNGGNDDLDQSISVRSEERHELLFREYGQEDLSRYKVEDEGDSMALSRANYLVQVPVSEFTIA